MHRHTIRLAAVAVFVIGPIAPAAWAQNTVQTIAGGGPNNLPALKSSLGNLAGVTLDGAGNVYVTSAGRVFRVDTTGNLTAAANGASGSAAVDRFGNIFTAAGCTIQKVSAQTGNLSIVAGTGTCFYSGDGGLATGAELNDPSGLAVDGSGNIFIADTRNCLIREVSVSTGVISTLAGTPPDPTGLLHCGNTGDGGPAINARVGFVNGLALDGSGNLFMADPSSCVIRKVSIAGIISTVAGLAGTCGYSGDGGQGASATVNAPYGVAVDSSGNVFVADTSNCVVRKVASSNGLIITVAGDFTVGCGYSGDGGLATSAQLNHPYGVAVDNAGDVLIADSANSVIREVSASTASISTFAGVAVPDPNHMGHLVGLPALSGDGYPATNGELGFLNDTPYGPGMATDRSGNVYIADTANNAVRKVSAATGFMTTVAGNGLIGFSGDGGPATSAQLFYPRDVAVDGSGNVYIMDTGNCVVRKITVSTGIITTVAGTLPDSAGNYSCGFSGDGGPATSAQLNPIDLMIPAGGVAVDRSGNIFIADTGNGVIREVSASTGIITTVAGNANSIFVGGGDGGPATSATFFSPYGVAVDGAGNIFIADTYDFAIREVTAVNGNIYTVAGNIALGIGFSGEGDGGPAGSAQLGYIFGVFLDPAGNLFIPDPRNCVIRQVSGSTGIISTVAGTPNRNGTFFCGFSGDGGPALSAVFDNPSGVGGDASGNLVVLDNTRVRTVAGLVQGPAASAVPFPDPLVFPSTPLATSDTLTVMLSNRGALPTGVSAVAISGANASVFSETDNCTGRSLAASGGSCAINVKFTPPAAAADSALLTITDTAGTQSVVLTGTGATAPGFLPSVPTIPFGNQQKTVKSSATSVMVTNNGSASLSIIGVGVSGANAGDFAISANSCGGAIVAVNATCSVSVTFTPSTTAAEVASLTFTDNAPGSPQSVGLTGTGTDFSIGLAPGGSATATVSAGSPATYNLQVTPISGFNGAVALSCTGAPQSSTCIPSEASATPNGNTAATFSVQVTTMARSVVTPGFRRQWRPFDGLRILPMVLIVALASTLLVFVSRFRGAEAQRRRVYTLAIPLGFLVFAIILIGCGGGSYNAPPPPGGTPAGNYTLTITGTSNGVSHSQTLTLTVN